MTTANAKETAAKKDVLKLQRAIVDGLEDVKAQDIQVFNTEHLSPLFERVIVASGTSNRQTKALAASVRDAVRDAGFAKPRMEGEDNGEWIIVDCGSAVAHIMQPAIRQYYHLEEIWGDTPVRLKLGAPKPVSAAAEPVAAAAKKAAAKKATAKAGGKAAGGKSASAKTLARKSKPVVPEVEYAPERPVIEPEKKPRSSSRTASTGTAANKPAAKAPAAKKTAAKKAPASAAGQAAKSPARKSPAVKVAAKTLVVGKKPPAKKAAAKAAPRRG